MTLSILSYVFLLRNGWEQIVVVLSMTETTHSEGSGNFEPESRAVELDFSKPLV